VVTVFHLNMTMKKTTKPQSRIGSDCMEKEKDEIRELMEEYRDKRIPKMYSRAWEKGFWKVPVLMGRVKAIGEKDYGIVEVWCIYCHVKHQHGWYYGRPKNFMEYRAAHCFKQTPYKETGYLISAENVIPKKSGE